MGEINHDLLSLNRMTRYANSFLDNFANAKKNQDCFRFPCVSCGHDLMAENVAMNMSFATGTALKELCDYQIDGNVKHLQKVLDMVDLELADSLRKLTGKNG